MVKKNLLIFPCSKKKEGAGLYRPLQPASITNFIGKKAADELLAARKAVAKDRDRAKIEVNSPLVPALALYSGFQYEVDGFKDRVAGAIRSGIHCLIISGGYGLIRAEEPIHSYEATITDTKKYWGIVIPEVLVDYIRRNQISRVFIGCSSSYVGILKEKGWAGDAKVYWCIPRLPEGEGGAMRKIPMLTGECIVELIDSGFQPNRRWTTRWPE